MVKNIENKKVKIGLALGSGSARGLTHIGVLKAIEEYGIRIDYIAGSSIGALIGGAYAMGMTIEEIEYIALQTDWKMMAKLFSLNLSFSSILNDSYLNEFLLTIFKNNTFDNLKIPFSAITTDIQTGKVVVLEKGDLQTAVRASISIPILLSPVTINKNVLVDGGLVNPTPVDVVKKNNMDKIIAVSLRNFNKNNIYNNKFKPYIQSNRDQDELSINDKIKYFINHPVNYLVDNKSKMNSELKYWSLLNQVYNIVQEQISDLSLQISKPDILIEPDTSEYKAYDFSKTKALIDVGYNEAIRKLINFNHNN